MPLMSVGVRVGVDAGEVQLNVVNAGRLGHLRQLVVFVRGLPPEADSDGTALAQPSGQVNFQHLPDAGVSQSDGVEVVAFAEVADLTGVALAGLEGGGLQRDRGETG